MNYRSVAYLNDDIVAWLPNLPRDLEIIVGIPRSGLLAANLLSLHLNLPLTDVEGFLAGRCMYSGQRCAKSKFDDFLATRRKVLVIDDTVEFGTQMRAIKEQIAAAGTQHRIYYAAVYVNRPREDVVDFFYKVLPSPRVFEWNVMHHSVLEDSCVDIDGVLCRDPTEEENDDGERYRHFLEHVAPLVIPSRRIECLVTCRLEKYRDLTEEWLARHGIEYKELVMMNFPDKGSRIASGSHGAFKASVYETTGTQLFIESSLRQAIEITNLSGKDVLCTETREMVRPGFTIKYRRSAQRISNRLLEDPVAVLIDLAKAAVGKAKRIIKRILNKTKRTKRLIKWILNRQ